MAICLQSFPTLVRPITPDETLLIVARIASHSHSIVPGGFDVTSYSTQLPPDTSLMNRAADRCAPTGWSLYSRVTDPSRRVAPAWLASTGERWAEPLPGPRQ
jgi:hypothetical protein